MYFYVYSQLNGESLGQKKSYNALALNFLLEKVMLHGLSKDTQGISNLVKYLKKKKKLKILVALLNQKDSNILLEEEM